MSIKEIAYAHYLPAKRKRRHTWETIAVEAGTGDAGGWSSSM